MTTFTPPVSPGTQRGDPDSYAAADRLFSYYHPHDTGNTVWKDENGVWQSGQYPYQGGDTSTVHDGSTTTTTLPMSGLATGDPVFLGGHTYHVTTAQALELIAAGFGAGINLGPVTRTWTTEDLATFDSKLRLTTDGSHATGQPTIDGNAFKLQLATGTTPGQSQLREFILDSDTAGWTDVHGIIEIDPPTYGIETSPGSGQFIIPQMGVCLRAQLDQPTNKHIGITMNNGTIFGLPILNIGAWRSNPDGTSFQNRQFSWPLFENKSLPYGWEFYLEGNIIRVRQFAAGESPDSTPWDHPTLTRTLNLDTDCGSTAVVPTPILPGTCGIISAHLGTDPRSACRIRRFFLERLD